MLDEKDVKERLKALDKSILNLQKKFGEDVFVDIATHKGVERFPVESLAVNYLLGRGIPKGRIFELYGEESNGKSLFAVYMGRQVQELSDGLVVYFDYEYSADVDFMKLNGLDVSPEKFRLVTPNSIEDGMEMMEELSKTGIPIFFIWDSTNSAKAKAEDSKDYGDALMGLNARSYSGALKKMVGHLSRSNCSLCFISQKRATMDQYKPDAVGVGNAVKYYSSIRIEVKRMEYLVDDKKDNLGIKMRIRTKKNKTFTANREIVIDIYFKGGIDKDKELVDYAKKLEVLEKAGSWYTLPDGQRFQGLEAVASYVKDKEDIKAVLLEKVKAILFQTISEDLLISEEQADKPVERKLTKTKKEVPIEALVNSNNSDLQEVEPDNNDSEEIAV